MIIEFAAVGVLAILGIIGTIVMTAKDGYRRIPTRRA